MPDQIGEEPLAKICELVRTDWDASNTTYSSDPRIHTGWWDWDREEPVVTVTNPNEFPVSGGEAATGYSYMTGDGSVGQQYAGTCLVNCWAGTFDTDALEGEGSSGGFLSPKILSWEMCKEVRRITRNYADGTTESDGSVQLTHVAPGEHRRIVQSDEDDEHPALFRYEVTVRYGYFEQ